MIFRIWNVSEMDEQALRAAFRDADEDRKSKVLSFRTVADQKQSLCADALVRQMLSEQSGFSPAEIQFTKAEGGKPFALNCNLQYSLSHSGDLVLCATDNSCIGADIEVFRPVSAALIRRVCTEEEQHYIASNHKHFFRIWTAKEALLKYHGTGIREDLRKISVFHEGRLQSGNLKFLSELHKNYAFTIVYE